MNIMANKKVQQLTAVENEQNDKSKINWKVRIKTKAFWLALIPAVLLLIQVIASVFGYTLDLGDLGNKLLSVVEALFMVLSILGIVVDPTTDGVGDSKQAPVSYTHLDVYKRQVEGAKFKVNIYLDDTLSGTVTNTKLYDKDGNLLIQRQDVVPKPEEKNLLVVFKLELREVAL